MRETAGNTTYRLPGLYFAVGAHLRAAASAARFPHSSHDFPFAVFPLARLAPCGSVSAIFALLLLPRVDRRIAS